MGAISAGASADSVNALDLYAQALGLAFQIRDDVLDVEGNALGLGKTAGKDRAQGKSTYPSLLGLDGSARRLDQLSEQMQAALEPIGSSAEALRALARYALARSN